MMSVDTYMSMNGRKFWSDSYEEKDDEEVYASVGMSQYSDEISHGVSSSDMAEGSDRAVGKMALLFFKKWNNIEVARAYLK